MRNRVYAGKVLLPSLKRRPGEDMGEYRRRRWAERDSPRRRAKKQGNAKCQFCGILMASLTVSKKHRRYCQKCKAVPDVRRHLRNLYMRRYWAKKKGEVPEAITFAEDII